MGCYIDDYCIENDLSRQQELEAIRQAKIYKEKDEALQQAHRQGWEQGKFEAMTKSTGRSYDAIASMEYKEAKK